MQTNVYTYYFTGADGYKFVYTKPVLKAVGLVIEYSSGRGLIRQHGIIM